MTSPVNERRPSSLPATVADYRVGGAMLVVSVLVFVAAAPFASTPLAAVPAFIPAYQAALVVCDLTTAALLLGQLYYFRSRALLALACGYAFTALMAVAHALTFPGLFAPTGLLGAGPQSTAWLYMFWHAGFPVFVMAYSVFRGPFKGGAEIAAWIGSAVVAAILLSLLATAGHQYMPAIMQGNRYTPLMIGVVGTVWTASVFALVVLWRHRPHTTLDVWLMVVMCAWVFDIALSAVLNAGRFDLGFYVGRLYGLFAATLVLLALLLENGRAYKSLRHRNRELDAARKVALDAERAKGAFLATMSHEIRTPMSGVMGMLELLSLTKLDGEQRTTLEVVRESGRSLLRIVDDILDFSQIEAGKLDLRPEPTFLPALVARTHAIYAGNASSKGIALSHMVDDRIDKAVMVDPLRLGQILNNLVSNAIKFTSSGFVSIRADLVEQRGETFVVCFTIEDTGKGIAQDDLDRLFEPFTRVRGAQVGGTGLGLSICRRLASLMNGLVEIRSAVGAGTRVLLTMPLAITDLPVAAPSRPPLPPPVGPSLAPTVEEARRSGRLVLVVDDHPINRMLLVKQLNSLGYAADTATHGLEAVECWSAGGFAAIVTDCHMPQMDGYELARHIRACEERSGAPRIPIIACTANAMDGEWAACLAAGMDGCLTKPVALAELGRKLEEWITPSDPIDRIALQELSGGDTHVERELLGQFRRYNEEDVRELKAAIGSNALEGVARAAHRIKGASRSVGAQDLADICERLELAARAKDLVAVQTNLVHFEREMRRLLLRIESSEAMT